MTESTFNDRYGDVYRRPAEAVESVLEHDTPTYAPDPIPALAATEAVGMAVARVAAMVGDPYTLYSPQQAAEMLTNLANLVGALPGALHQTGLSVQAMHDRGDVESTPDTRAASQRYLAALESSSAHLRQAQQIATEAAEHFRSLPYTGYTDPGDDAYPDALADELRRRGALVDGIVPPHSQVEEIDGEERVIEFVAVINFHYAGFACVLMDAGGWELAAGIDDEHLGDLPMRLGFYPSVHPVALIGEALAAIDMLAIAAESATAATGDSA